MELVTESEIRLLQELRERILDLNLSPEQDQDKNLVRWLRARKHNLAGAEQMIRKNHDWLQDKNMDDLVSSPDPPGWGQRGHYPWYFSGFDRDNNPVIVLRLGEWDAKSAVNTGQRSAFEKYALKITELVWRACLISSKGQPWTGQFVALYDFKGLTFSQVTCLEAVHATMAIGQTFDANYPELLRKGFVLNAPWPFQILFKLMRPALDERTYNKLCVLGSDPTVWRKEIGNLVPFDQFPSVFGGDGEEEENMIISPDGTPCKRRPSN